METIISNPAFSAFNIDSAVSFVRPFNAKESLNIEGYRNSIIRYRETKDGVKIVAAKPAKVVTLPAVMLPEDNYLLPDEAKKVLIGVIEDCQDTLIKDLIERGESTIDWSAVSLDSALVALTAVRVSQRLTAEQIAVWVGVALKDVLANRAAAISAGKLHTELQAQLQVAATMADYTKALSTLSAPVPNLKQQSAMACKNLLVQAKDNGVNDDISAALLAKLEKILNPEIASDNL